MKSSNPNMERFREAFREEAKELLVGLEDSLLSLEEDPLNEDEISAVFRAMHTIKGSSSMFGFDYISTFTHDLENLFDKVRNGEIKITPPLISSMLECKDYISELLLKENFPEEELESTSNTLLEKVFRAAAGVTLDMDETKPENATEIEPSKDNSSIESSHTKHGTTKLAKPLHFEKTEEPEKTTSKINASSNNPDEQSSESQYKTI